MSCFADVPSSPPDPILNLGVEYKADTCPNKINLGIGAYRTAEGQPWILPCVAAAEERILAGGLKYNKEYPPIQGYPEYQRAAQEIMFGEDSPALAEGRIATLQSISGTGALHIAFCFAKQWLVREDGTPRAMYYPNVTWPNHHPIYAKSYCTGQATRTYTYIKDGTLEIDVEGMLKDIAAAEEGSVFLFHPSAHNPTGCDPTPEEWDRVIELIKEHHHIPLFDCAYQGFASGDLNRDAYPIRKIDAQGGEMIVCQSFSKNFGLYAERAGAIHVVHNKDKDHTNNILSTIKSIIRQTYSVNPVHGAYIVSVIWHDAELRQMWMDNVHTMCDRILEMRTALKAALDANGCPGDWSHITRQIGMFSYTGLTKAQVKFLKEKHHVYMAGSGRISISGLSPTNVERFADAVKEAVMLVKE